MIEFTAEQEMRAMRRDCRVWTEFMVEAWYSSDYPHATDYPAEALVSDLREVYFACHSSGVQNIVLISLLGFLVLRAKTLECSEVDVQCIADFFMIHARSNKFDYAQDWIELYLEEATVNDA